MKRTIAWLVMLGFAAGSWCLAGDYPLPRILPIQRTPFAQKKDADNAKNGKDKDAKDKDAKDKDAKDKDAKDKDAKDKDTKDSKDTKEGKDEKDSKDKDAKNGTGDAAKASDKPAANLWPANPFPPAAPAVLDPRTGAWEQVYGPGGPAAPEVSEGAIFPPPGPDGICPPGAAAQLQAPTPAKVPTTPVIPVSAVSRVPETAAPPVMMATPPVQVVPGTSRGSLRDWLDRLRSRPRAQRVQGESRERTLNISKNWQTGSWEIEETTPRPPR